MKSKLISSFLIALLALVSLTLVSALTITPSPSSLTLTQNDLSEQFSITLTNLSNVSFVKSSNILISSTTLNDVSNVTFTVSATSIPLGTSYGYVNITAVDATNSSINATLLNYQVTLTNTTNMLCSGSNPADLEIDNLEFNLVSGYGDEDDLFFYPLDEIELSFNVANNGDYDVSDIEITACLYDVTKKKCVFDEDDMEIDNDNFDLDSGDDMDVTLSLNIDPDSLVPGNTEYVFYVAAKGDIDDNDAGSLDEQATCGSDLEDKVEIRTDEKFVVVSDITLPESVSCDSTFTLDANLWNLGDESIDNDNIFIGIYSKDLGIDEKIELSEDLDALESRVLTVELKTPKNLALKTYKLEISVYEDDSYSDKDLYQNKEDDEAIFTALVNVDKCTLPASASITAELSSETPTAVIGNQVIVESTIKNTGSSAVTYTITIDGNSAWSTVAQIDPQVVTIPAGESKKVNIYLNVNKDAEVGTEEFTIKATQGLSVSSQKVQIELESGFSSTALVNHFKQNWFIYVVVLVNLILIIAIILVVRSILRRSR